MPIDPSLVPALEQELVHAKKWSAGGQPPNKGRIAAIEAAIRAHKRVAGGDDAVETADASKAEVAEAPAKEKTVAAKPAERTKA